MLSYYWQKLLLFGGSSFRYLNGEENHPTFLTTIFFMNVHVCNDICVDWKFFQDSHLIHIKMLFYILSPFIHPLKCARCFLQQGFSLLTVFFPSAISFMNLTVSVYWLIHTLLTNRTFLQYMIFHVFYSDNVKAFPHWKRVSMQHVCPTLWHSVILKSFSHCLHT